MIDARTGSGTDAGRSLSADDVTHTPRILAPAHLGADLRHRVMAMEEFEEERNSPAHLAGLTSGIASRVRPVPIRGRRHARVPDAAGSHPASGRCPAPR